MAKQEKPEFNIYCDESCHLERDGHQTMVLGAVWCPKSKSGEISKAIRGLKSLHGLTPDSEAKWTKISPKAIDFYLGLVNYFFAESDLRFRALIIPDKTQVRDLQPNQAHDDWYYDMYFDMLKVLLSRDECYNIYVDIKDTRGDKKVQGLWQILRDSVYDFDSTIVKKVQMVKSHEVQLIQLADVLIGCISFANRINAHEQSSQAKRDVVTRVRTKASYSLAKTTLPRDQKVNIYRWRPRDVH